MKIFVWADGSWICEEEAEYEFLRPWRSDDFLVVDVPDECQDESDIDEFAYVMANGGAWALTKTEGYEPWMERWIRWDEDKRVFNAWGPDEFGLIETVLPSRVIKALHQEELRLSNERY